MQKLSSKHKRCNALLAAVYAGTSIVLPVQAADPKAGVSQAAAPSYDTMVRKGDADTGNARYLTLGVGKSLIVDLPREAKDVLITDQKVANAVIRSAKRAYVFASGVGSTSMFFFDENGQQIAVFDLHVHRDVATLNNTMRKVLPTARVHADAMGDNIVLTGAIDTSADARTAIEMAQQMAGTNGKVINKMQVVSEEQVHLKVIIAEMKRDIVKQLGVDLSGAWQVGTAVISGSNLPSFIASRATGAGEMGYLNQRGATNNAAGVLKALEQNGLSKTLAEPTLTAVSGESANFMAGGEVPYASSRDRDGNVQVSYKPYGVSLGFTPVVLAEGRISLKIKTEVSDISQGTNIGGSTGSTALSFVKRGAETTVEIPSGGSLVMAGLFQDNVRQGASGLPGLKELPILGALFRSRDFETGQTELAIVVTPYIVKPTSPRNIALPTDNFEAPNDASAGLMGRFNKIYGVAPEGQKPVVSKDKPAPQGRWGYIID